MISVIAPSRCGTKLVSNEFFGFSFNLNRDLQISKAPLKSQAQGTSFFTSAEHSQGPVLSLISTYGSHTSILTSIIWYQKPNIHGKQLSASPVPVIDFVL